MAFFEEVDELGLVERHIRRVTGIEMEQARNLLRVYTVARQRLQVQLATAGSGTFTEAQMGTVLAQLEGAINRLNFELGNETFLGLQLMEEQSVDDSTREIERFEKKFRGISLSLPVDSILASLDRETLLLNRYRSSLASFNATIRDDVQRELTQAVIQRTSYFDAVQRVGQIFPWFRAPKRWQVERIARTELHNIYNVSKMDALGVVKRDFLPGLKKALMHPKDTRIGKDSLALAKLNPIVDIDQPFRFEFKGQKRVFMAPPDRPNDRAILVPFMKEWDEDN